MSEINTFLAPAKINLFLHITGRRADGYHTLQSIFQLLDYYDELTLTPLTDDRILRNNDLNNVPPEQDLCVRAAKALQSATGCQLGVSYTLNKRIPMGGGLGGGSSDAASMLLALNSLWKLKLNRQQLMQIGLTLGADIPVFIFGQTAWAEGIGDQLSGIPLPEVFYDQHYLVITPLVNVSTAQIFSHSRLTRDTKPLKITDFSRATYSIKFRNDLEKIVCEEFPEVASTLAWLNQYGHARMSGSGASAFIAVNSKQQADELLRNRPADTVGFVAKGIKMHPHVEYSGQ